MRERLHEDVGDSWHCSCDAEQVEFICSAKRPSMSLRFVLAAALLTVSTVSASALQLTIPSDATQTQPKKDSTDGLFNHKVPNHWQNSSDNNNELGGVHLTAHSSNDLGQSGSYDDANKPMSEFYGPKPQQNDAADTSPGH
jgi:hypothetical protein